MTDRAFPVETGVESLSSRWQELLQEATGALVRMDADRLEELARCCEDLNRKRATRLRERSVANERRRAESATTDTATERASLAVMGRLLEETRANLRVLTRLHVLRFKAAAGGQDADHHWHPRTGGGEYGDN